MLDTHQIGLYIHEHDDERNLATFFEFSRMYCHNYIGDMALLLGRIKLSWCFRYFVNFMDMNKKGVVDLTD